MIVRDPFGDLQKGLVERDIVDVEQHLDGMQNFLDRVPEGDDRTAARLALIRAFQAGETYSRLRQVQLTPPVDPDGIPELGPALRKHVQSVRSLYGRISDLGDDIDEFTLAA